MKGLKPSSGISALPLQNGLKLAPKNKTKKTLAFGAKVFSFCIPLKNKNFNEKTGMGF